MGHEKCNQAYEQYFQAWTIIYYYYFYCFQFSVFSKISGIQTHTWYGRYISLKEHDGACLRYLCLVCRCDSFSLFIFWYSFSFSQILYSFYVWYKFSCLPSSSSSLFYFILFFTFHFQLIQHKFWVFLQKCYCIHF